MAGAQTPVEHPDRHAATLISPYYFGPNAFPVPDMLDGSVSRDLRIEASADFYAGKRNDRTIDALLRINVPLYTDRVNLSAWIPAMEWWRNSDENIEACRLSDKVADNPRIRKGHGVADFIVSTDIEAVREGAYCPAIAIRAAFKTASSDDDYCTGRFYDSPGYFFDLAVGKTFGSASDGFFRGFRGAASVGFLCWQTDNGRQNDATMYGVQLKLITSVFSLCEMWGGYSGWENAVSKGGDIAHDQPMTLKSILSVPVGRLEFLARHQAGLRDYPYHQFSLGVAYRWNVLGR